MQKWERVKLHQKGERIDIGFFWTIGPDGEIELSYGSPNGSSVYAEGAGDREGLYSEDTKPFIWYSWLVNPDKPVLARCDGRDDAVFDPGDVPDEYEVACTDPSEFPKAEPPKNIGRSEPQSDAIFLFGQHEEVCMEGNRFSGPISIPNDLLRGIPKYRERLAKNLQKEKGD